MSYFRPLLLILTVAIFSAATWADGIDPKTIIKKGSGSTAITLTMPNPTFSGTATTGGANCLSPTDACFFQVFQNQTGVTLTSLNILINDISGYSFTCAITSESIDFTNCSYHDNGSVTDVFFSGGTGVAPASQQCVPDSPIDQVAQYFGTFNCQKYEPDDYKFVGGEFGLLIDATASENFNNKSVSGSVVTPEPREGILLLFGALAFGLFKLVRRAA